MSADACPGCGSPPTVPVGTPFVGAVGFFWWKRSFEEQLYRCAEGHIYSVRVSEGETSMELHESVEAWLLARTGTDAPTRPPTI